MKKKLIFIFFAVNFLFLNINGLLWASPDYRDSIIIGVPADTITLDPAVVSDSFSHQAVSAIYDTLVEINPAENKVVPSLAVSWYSDSNYTQWVFALREGVFFSDGAPFDAESVKFSFLRQADLKNAYHYPKYGYYSYYASVFGGFPGILSGINVIGKNKVEFIFSKPVPNFLEILAIPQFSIVSPAAAKKHKDDFWANPAGTGPYALASWNYGSRITLKKNTKYWKQKPAANKIIMQVIPDHNQRFALFKRGYIDIMSGAGVNDHNALKQDANYKVLQHPYAFDIILGINCGKDVFKDARIKQALRAALSKDIIDSVYMFEPPKNKMNYKQVFYKFKKTNSNYIKAYKKLKETSYNKKRELEFIYTEGLPLYGGDTDLVPEKIRFLLMECGFTIKLKQLSFEKFIKSASSGNYDIALMYTDLKNRDENLFYLTYFNQSYPAKYNLNKFHCYSKELKNMLNGIYCYGSGYDERYSLEEMNYFTERNNPYVFLNRLSGKTIYPSKIGGLRFDSNNCLRFDKIYIK